LSGNLPLVLATQMNDINIVKALLEHDVDANLKDSCGMSSLHFAAENGHLDIVKILLEHHADVNLR
ncbi:hypothetical protein C0993_005711, partial [Termitomyces sp. T159_Od127]